MELLNKMKQESVKLWRLAESSTSLSDREKFLKRYYEIVERYRRQKQWQLALQG